MRDSPRLCIYDGDIEKFTGKKLGEIKVGDTVTMTIKCKVTGVDQHERYQETAVAEGNPSPAKEGKEPEKVTEERAEFDVIGGGEEKPTRTFTYKSGRF